MDEKWKWFLSIVFTGALLYAVYGLIVLAEYVSKRVREWIGNTGSRTRRT